MKSIKSLLFSSSPFGYISKNKKRVISDFLAIEECEDNNSYTYQYLNSSYYKELIVAICLQNYLDNMSNGRKLDIDKLQVGQEIQFKNKYYQYLGKDELGAGYRIKLVYGKQDGVTSIFSREILENRASKVNRTKRRKIPEVRQDFGNYFGIKNLSWTNEESVIILVEKKILNEILTAQIDLGKRVYTIGQICSVGYLKDSMEISYPANANNTEKRMILFSSSPDAIVEYLEENNGIVDESKVFVVGDKWFKKSQISNLINLEDACREFEIPIRTYSSVFSVMNNNSVELIESINNEYCWLEASNDEHVITFDFIANNRAYSEAIEKLNVYLSEISQEPNLKYLDKLLKLFLKMNYNQVIGSSDTLERQMIAVSEYMLEKKLDNIDEVSCIMYDIYSNRFGYQVRNKIENIRTKDVNCLLIVMDEMLEESRNHFINDKQLTILSYKSDITEDLYGKFEQVILISPYKTERRKWLSSYLAKDITVLVPQLQENFLIYSLKKDKHVIQKLDNMDLFNSKNNSAYLSAIEKYLSKKTNDNDIGINLHKNSIDNFDEEELVEKKFSELISKYASEEEIQSDNSTVDVTIGIDLESGGNIFGTEFSKIFVVGFDNIVRKIDTKELKVGQTIIEFSVPYADELYRNRYKSIVTRLDSLKKSSNEVYLDYKWKKSLLDYIENRRLTSLELKEKMESLGFSSKTIAFYAAWSSIEKMPILSRDKEFIRYVGIMIGDNDMIAYPEKYEQASKSVKKKLVDDRVQFLGELEGRSLDEIKSNSAIKSFIMDKVVLIEREFIEEVPRILTNKILRGK
ncbi:hypothetical protein [Oceanobacillus neutriphilus]|uniref:Uncharacterized protein n=1 Tax=Oceanobacillus neutriphilus TaxID=531815 RepID=A0ABQ2NV45_9BACI|nr:hypothetical protein [Oceanobacillus neutriphilus]GGP11237.1 hypothetical protein GCM10011346_22600 [Oceanobacillus neutriphilus]